MTEFLISLTNSIKEVPKKFKDLFNELDSVGAIQKDKLQLNPNFLIAKAVSQNGFLKFKDLAKPNEKLLKVKHGVRFIKENDLVLILNVKNHTRVIKILGNKSNYKSTSLAYLTKTKSGKLVVLDLKSDKKLHINAREKALKELPKFCVLKLENNQKIKEVYGSLLDSRIDEKIVLENNNRVVEFSKNSLDEAKSFGEFVDSSLYKQRKDLRNLEFITIDPIDAKDFDDAIFWDNKNSTLYIAIADVSEYVTPNSSLDTDAKKRLFSLYFPHICYPMLPKSLSENLCSLRANEVKLAMVFELKISKAGIIKTTSLYEAIIEPKHNFNYEEIDLFLDSSLTNKEIPKWLKPLNKLTQILKEKRLKNGFDFMASETKMILDSKENIKSVYEVFQTKSHSLIEECMLLANINAANLLSINLNNLGIYRSHDEIKPQNIFSLTNDLKELGINAEFNKDVKKFIKTAQDKAKDLGVSKIADMLIIRAQEKAQYSVFKSPHFGLGFEAYTHFTSPIRRYADILAHRLLKILMINGELKGEVKLDSKTQKRADFIIDCVRNVEPMLNDFERLIDKTEIEFKDRKYARLVYDLLESSNELKVCVRILDSRFPAIGIIESVQKMKDSRFKNVIGARVYIIDSSEYLEKNHTYKAELTSANLANAKIYAMI